MLKYFANMLVEKYCNYKLFLNEIVRKRCWLIKSNPFTSYLKTNFLEKYLIRMETFNKKQWMKKFKKHLLILAIWYIKKLKK